VRATAGGGRLDRRFSSHPHGARMRANTRQVETLFDTNVSYQVPLFQRPYVWQEAANWKPLWEDLEDLLDRQLKTGRVRPHFLGAIVLEQLGTSAGSIDKRLVIDGQQRFTTLQLFLIAARNLCEAHASPKMSARFLQLTQNAEERIDRPDDRYKLLPTNQDRAAFRVVHEARTRKALDGALAKSATPGASAIADAYRYFEVQLGAWLSGRLDEEGDKQLLAAKTIEDRIAAVWNVIKGGLLLVVIDLEEGDDSQIIFETLNHLGTPLLPADLIKNFLFRRALVEAQPDPAPNVLEQLYAQHWKRFDDPFWREEQKQGRLKRPRIDLFINHYLSMMMREEVRSTHLFDEFKHFVAEPPEGQRALSAAEHIARLAEYGDVFRNFFAPDGHPRLALFLERLQAVDTATVFPFLLYAHTTLMPERQEDFDGILAVIESFLMRRLITAGTTKNYNRLFIDLIRAVESAGELTVRAVATQLTSGEGASTAFPSDADIHTALTTLPLYGRIAREKVLAVLKALELAAKTSKSEAVEVPDTVTIEHVMPQNWPREWPLPPAAAPRTSTEEADATEARNRLVQTIGNLTLVTNSLNPTLSDSAWETKRPMLMKYARLNLTQYFHDADADVWDDSAIERRTEHLYRQLVQIWPFFGAPAATGTSPR